jgi:hypothetical protein
MDLKIADLKLLPFWKELEIVNDRPTLDSMHKLLEKHGISAPRSGSACIQLLWDHRLTLGSSPLPAPTATPAPPPPVFYPLIDQCETGLRAEAEERMKTCIESSYRTDNGLIMLENDLVLFVNSDDWLRETINEWLPRLKSTMQDEFKEAIQLWVLSHHDVD